MPMHDPPRDCPRCGGEGRRWYGSTATWRGGMGGSACSIDQCDVCWGSGSKDYPYPDVRELERQLATKQIREELEGLKIYASSKLGRFSGCFDELMQVLRAQQRRRKLPDTVDEFGYHRFIESVVRTLERYREAADE